MFAVSFCIAAFVLRIISLAVSVRHEKALKADGAVEFGAANTKLLALTHIAFYIAAFTEGLRDPQPIDAVTVAGVAIYAVSMLMLAWVVKLLGRFWTVKILIARDHDLVIHPLFKRLRHPNYFLNILPELVGLALALHAFVTLAVGLPLYLIPLITRIRQEERAMRETFSAY